MIEAFLAGTSAREIARWANPPVAHNSVSRFMRARVKPALSNAAKLLSVDPPRTGTVSANSSPTRARQQVEHRQVDRHQVEQLAVQAVVAAPVLSLFRQRLEKLHGRIDRTLDRAEADDDLTPLAPLFNAASKNLEMLGRATGELEPQGGANFAIQIISPATENAMPRVTYASVDQLEASTPEEDEGIFTIGAIQLGG